MIVCHCKQMSDKQIRKAIQNGATTMRALVRDIGAGTECGGCIPSVKEVFNDEFNASNCTENYTANYTAPRTAEYLEITPQPLSLPDKR